MAKKNKPLESQTKLLTQNSWLPRALLYVAWIQATVATFGSLFFSEVLKFPPCVLCWYQRIAMYPLVLLLAIGIVRKDKGIAWYVLPLSIVGMVIAGFHNLLYWKIIPESQAPCIAGVSCTTKFIEWFGFVTIPFLSFLAFMVITLCLWLYQRMQRSY